MANPSLICPHELLRQSLDDKLGEQQEEELARHLAECASCQQELERLAAAASDWSKVGSALAQEAASERQSGHSLRQTPTEADAEEYTSADFAVDFLDPAATPDTLGRLGDIDILEVIGQGGMGIVLKGHQPELNRFVAVKVLGPHLATSGPARKRFAREAQATAAILHPSVMPILMVSSSGNLPYLVMPYVACESLQQRIDRAGPLETLDLLRIGVQTARGLAAAHAQGLVHRDIKPANILLERGVDRVLLTDFGLARAIDDASITRTGIIAGTPQFMSPEQAKGEPVDARSDLFSLGSVLYTAATGRPPFRAESTYGILRRIADSPPRPIREVSPHVPDWLAAIVGKLQAKEASGRFATAEEVAELLEQCLAHVQQPASARLPASVQQMLANAGSAKATGEINRTRMFVWTSLTACGLVAATLAVVAVVNNAWPEGTSKKLGDPGEGPASASQVPGTENSTNTDWDSATREVESLHKAADDFESRAGRLWDKELLEIEEPDE